MQRFLISCLSVFALSTPVWAARGPVETVSGFYDLRIANHSTGAPSGLELADYSAYLGPEMVCLLGASLRYKEKYSKSLPDKTPPFSEGDLYSSAPAVPTRFELGPAQISGSKASVKVHFYADQDEVQDDKGWDDVVQLAMIRNKWLITDIEYSGHQPQGNKGALQENLRKTLSEPETGSGWDARELSACTLDPMPAHRSSKSEKASRGGKHGRHAGKGTGKSGKAARGGRSSAKAAHGSSRSHAKSSGKSSTKSAKTTKKSSHKR